MSFQNDDTKVLEKIKLELPASDYVDKLYDSLTKIIKANEINQENIVKVALNLMQIVEKYPNISGQQKKALVIHVLRRFCEDNKDLHPFIEHILPSVIDTMISLDRSEVIVAVATGCKSLCG